MIVCTETVLIGRKCDPMEEKVKQQYDRWLSQPGMPADLAEELKSIAGNEDAITDRFYRELEFGTGGLRGVIGAGTNRMNVYNIRKATQGLANYLNASDLPKKVAIGYDSRIKSDVFAKETAAVLAANGIKAYIYPRLEPTPALSWAVRYYGCGAGVCVTASHNPAVYNGIKVFMEGGRDADETLTAAFEGYIRELEGEPVETVPYEEGLAAGSIQLIDPMNDYIDSILKMVDAEAIRSRGLHVVLDPMYGVSKTALQTILLTTRCDVEVIHERRDTLFGGRLPAPNLKTLAGLTNALKVVGKKKEDVKIVTSGAGAAAIAITKLLLSAGFRDITMCDRKGAIYKGREGLNWIKEEMAEVTNLDRKSGALADMLVGADVFIGVSAPGTVTTEMVRTMNRDAIIFACANPTPEIFPDEAKAGGAAVVSTGRSDYPNQINNVLAFPGIFRGAFDVRASDINEEMKMAAAKALAELISDDELSAEYIIPKAFDKRVGPAVAEAVAEAARKSGVARM